MCSGIPCRGQRVRLLRSVRHEEQVIPAGEEGTVEQEHLPQRQVTVDFDRFRFRVKPRIDADDLEVLGEAPSPVRGF
jgi:hypothetical protein